MACLGPGIGPASFTASTTVFALLAALSNHYRIAPFLVRWDHARLRRLFLAGTAANAALALILPLAAAVALVAMLVLLSQRLVAAGTFQDRLTTANAALEAPPNPPAAAAAPEEQPLRIGPRR